MIAPTIISGTREEVIEQFLRVKDISGEGDSLALSWFDVPGLTEAEHEAQLRCFGEDVMPVLER